MSKDRYLDHLAEISLFSQCSKKDLQTISRTLTDTDVKAGTVLMSQGERASSYVILMDGEVSIVKDGEEVATVGKGAIIGEMAILMDRERSASAVATTDCEILVGERRNFDALLDEVSGLARKVLHSLAERIADNEEHIHHH